MDIATIGGMIAGTILVLIVMMLSGSLNMYWDFLSIVIVFIGSALSVLTRYSVGGFISGTLAGISAFFNSTETPEEIMESILHLADVARKGSILALDKEPIEHPFMHKGIQLAVDGTDPAIIEEILNDEISVLKKKHASARQIYMDLGEAAPAFGMIGTVIGLVVIMANLSDPSKIGPGLAVALITTLYGAILANVVYIPIGSKLKLIGSEEARNYELIKTGVISIMNGLNPNIIRNRLKAHLTNGGGDGG